MNSRIRTIAATALLASAVHASVANADMDAARQALSNNDYPSAIEALDAVLAQSPDNAEARFMKGLALARSGDTARALTVLDTFIKNNPDMAEGWNNLGVLRARDGDVDGAQAALEKAVRIDPEHGPAQENLGDIYVAMAQRAYARAGELESDNAVARTKSEQLSGFISGGTGTDDSDKAGGKTMSTSASENVARTALDIDTSTPQNTLQSWAAAWSAQDVDAYLGMYSDAFVPEDGMSRSAWVAQRRERVSAPARIDVDISDMRIERRGEQVRLAFMQRYQSNTYQDQERKALLLQQTTDGWRILREGAASDVALNAAPTQGGDGQTPGEAPTQDDGTDRVRPADAQSQPSQADETTSETAQAGASGQADKTQAASTQTPDSAQTQTEQGQAQTQARQAVASALTEWARAWSAQDVRGYLNAYSDNYEPQGGTSLSDWVRSRRQAVRSPSHIEVELSNIQISFLGDDRAQARFNQHYKSNAYEDRERKRVTLVHEDGGWRIVRES